MIRRATLCLLLAAIPSIALAQGDRSRVTGEAPLAARENLRACLERHDSLADRKAFLDREKMNVDLDGDAIAAEGARLAEDLRRLDANDRAAVATYNTLSAEQNRRVEAHNRRVADMNSAASRFNVDAVDVTAYCNWRVSRVR